MTHFFIEAAFIAVIPLSLWSIGVSLRESWVEFLDALDNM